MSMGLMTDQLIRLKTMFMYSILDLFQDTPGNGHCVLYWDSIRALRNLCFNGSVTLI